MTSIKFQGYFKAKPSVDRYMKTFTDVHIVFQYTTSLDLLFSKVPMISLNKDAKDTISIKTHSSKYKKVVEQIS